MSTEVYNSLRPSEILRNDPEAVNYAYIGNLIANAIELEGYAENQLYEDIFTIAGEDLIRQYYGYYVYDRDTADLLKIQDQLERAVDPTNPQIPEFELPRNYQNLINNINLVNARFDADSPYNRLPFVEISPPPKSTDPGIQSEIEARGYPGDAYILLSFPVSDIEGRMRERVVQFWVGDQTEFGWLNLLDRLKQAAYPEYGEVAGFSNQLLNENNQQFGADIIARAGFLNQAQFGILETFLREQGIDFELSQLDNIMRLKSDFAAALKGRFDIEFRKLVQKAANINCFAQIAPDLEVIYKKIVSLSNEIRLYIEKEIDPSTNIQYEQYTMLTDDQRFLQAAQEGYGVKFCGGNIRANASFVGALLSSGSEVSSNKIFGERSANTPDLSEPCDGCGARWWIKEGDSNTYHSSCPGCGKNVSC